MDNTGARWGGMCALVIAGAIAMEGHGMDECCANTPAKTASLTADAPIVCTLTDAAEREQRDKIQAMLSQAANATRELEDGYAVEFENGHTAEFVAFIEFERECCAFLEFTLAFAPNKGPVTLSITGPEGTKEFLKDVFAGATS